MRKGASRVVLFASIGKAQHESLRYIAYKEKRSVADITREALSDYIKRKSINNKIGRLKARTVETLEVEAIS